MNNYNNEKILFENKPANNFREAYPIGNGFLGGMIYGNTDTFKVNLNHDELWTGFSSKTATTFSKDSYIKARDLALEGKYKESTELIKKEIARYDAAAYKFLGDIYTEVGIENTENYRRELDIGNATAKVTFENCGEKITYTAFATAVKGVIVQNFKFEKKHDLKVKLDTYMVKKTYIDGDILKVEGECPITCHRQDDSHTEYADCEGKHGIRFLEGVTVRTDGKVQMTTDGITVKDATELTSYLTCSTSYKDGKEDGFDGYREAVDERLKSATSDTLDNIYTEHTEDYKKYFDRVSLTFKSKDMSEVPTSERIKSYLKDNTDSALVTLQYNYGRYLMISGSRPGSVALNLQGIWNDQDNAPWCSNYTTNINTEMNYWCALQSGLPEMLDPLRDLVHLLDRTGKDTAKYMFGARGSVAFHNTDIFGYNLPANGRAKWAFFPYALGWLSRECYNKYLYTENIEDLKDIYPVLRDVVEFSLDTMIDDGDYLIFAPGTSAENSYRLDGEVCEVARSTTFFGAIIREVFEEYLTASRILGISDSTTDEAEKTRRRLLPVRITDDGKIEEWYFGKNVTKEPEEDEHHHRHISNLYDLYPGDNIITNEQRAAAKKSLDMRGDDASGWSLTWKMCTRGRLNDSDAESRLLKLYFRTVDSKVVSTSMTGGGVYPNLFCAHPPFQIDGNFGFVAAIYEMLLGERNGQYIPIPAIPKELDTGAIKGMRIKGNKRVDLSFENGKVVEFKVY